MQEETSDQTAVPTMPRLGDPAPNFTAETTQGPINFPADYAGKWVILFSHPADFTPVCTSEFMTFASMQEEFRAYNTELVGLSIDGLFSHIAWLRSIKEKMTFRDMKDIDVTFPLIDDVSMNVSTKYGMVMPGEATTQAVRAVFVIDPEGIVRTILYYPLALGRNFNELLRVVKGLQTIGSPANRPSFHQPRPMALRAREQMVLKMASSASSGTSAPRNSANSRLTKPFA